MRELPPFGQLLRLSFEEGEELRVCMPFHEDVVGRPGFLHGGAIAGLLEFAAFATLARAIGDETVKMKPVTVDYMRGGGEHETFAAAQILRLGNRMANVEAAAWQHERTTPIATARINFLLDRS